GGCVGKTKSREGGIHPPEASDCSVSDPVLSDSSACASDHPSANANYTLLLDGCQGRWLSSPRELSPRVGSPLCGSHHRTGRKDACRPVYPIHPSSANRRFQASTNRTVSPWPCRKGLS